MTIAMKSTPEIILIAAVARNGVIGRDNALPWKLKADLRHFKSVTMGHPILMGRKTWESLGRPLPGRRNLVVTRNPDFIAAGGEVFPDLDAALTTVSGVDKIFVIGGGELYRLTLPKADGLILTEIQAEIAGDTRFPTFSSTQFREINRETHTADDNNEYAYDFVTYERVT